MTFTIKHKMAAAVAGCGLAVSSMLISAPTATAIPSGCHFEMSNRDAIGTCDKGTGQFRIRLDCDNTPDKTSIWATPGRYVSVHCTFGMPRGVTFETN